MLKDRTATSEFMDFFYFFMTQLSNRTISIGSCVHMAHLSCFNKFLDDQANENNVYYCPVCRRLLNGFYPMIIPATINREWRHLHFPNPLFIPDQPSSDQWIDMNRMNSEVILKYIVVSHFEILNK